MSVNFSFGEALNARLEAERAVDVAMARLEALTKVRHDLELQVIAEQNQQKLKQVNQNLLLSNRQLAAANADLEAFSCSVAQELRGLIRQIADFPKILIENFGTQLPEEVQRHLDKLTQGAQQMRALIDDLSRLARVSRQALSLQQTPLSMIVMQALESLQQESAGRDIWWRIDNLATVECDRGLIKQVFVSLLSNALKYTRDCQFPVIEVGQLCQSDDYIFFVCDNGIGFDMACADQLFDVFERVHSSRNFEGAGIELAIAERIIHKHGGHIWTESAPGCGATFFFTVSATAAQPL